MASKVGLKDLYFAAIKTETTTSTTYDVPFRIAKAITAGLEPVISEAESYADDQMDDYYSAVTAYNVTLDINDLSPENEAKLLGRKVDTNGAVVTGTSDNAPHGALMFRAERSDGTYEYRVLYKVRFAPSAENYGTKADSITYQNPQITAKAMARVNDGQYGARIVADDDNQAAVSSWFTKPYEATGVDTLRTPVAQSAEVDTAVAKSSDNSKNTSK